MKRIILVYFFLCPVLFAGNKQNIDWLLLKGDHFDVYFPDKYQQLAESTLQISENANYKLSRILNHQLTEVISIFVYPNPTSFQNTNLLPVPLDEGTGGFTEASRKRIALPFTGSHPEFNRILVHELVHAFQYDMIFQRSGLNTFFRSSGFLPLWFAEGLAEYLSIGLDTSYFSVLQDAYSSELLPTVRQLDRMQVANGYLFYKVGQSICQFIAEQYGENVLGNMILSYARLKTTEKVIRANLGISLDKFEEEWRIHLKRTLIQVFTKKTPSETGTLLTRHRENRSLINLHPVLNPVSNKYYYLSARENSISLVERSLPTERVKKDFEVFDRKTKKEIFNEKTLWVLRNDDFVNDVNLLSNRLTITADGRYIFFAATRNDKESILRFDLETEKLEPILSTDFEIIKQPSINSDGTKLIFCASKLAQLDIYIYELKSGKLQQITNSARAEAYPAFASSPNTIYFSAEETLLTGNMDIYSFNLESDTVTPIIEAEGHQFAPYATPDNKVYFISKHAGQGNLFVLDQLNQEVLQLTDSIHSIDYFTKSKGKYTLLQTYRALGFDILRLDLDLAQQKAPPIRLDWDARAEGAKLQEIDAKLITMPSGKKAALRPSMDFFLLGFQYSDLYGVGGFVTTMASDHTGNHSLNGYVDYSGANDALNFEASYTNRTYKGPFTLGAYRRTNQFSIFNLADLTSINNFLYTPGFLASIYQVGIYGVYTYPLSKYWQAGFRLELAREEQLYFQSTFFSEQPSDIATNLQTISFFLQRNSSLLSLYGPVDGTYIGLFTSMTSGFSANDYVFQRVDFDIRNYLSWNNRITLASRLNFSSVLGKDKARVPYYLGGYNTVRGYSLFSFKGLNRMISSLELRFPVIEAIIVGLPVPWLLRGFQGVAFIDAGAAVNSWQTFKAVDNGRTQDLILSYGLGFRYVLSPGLNIRIDWATPYDLVTSLPISKWQGVFSLGYAF